MQTLKLTKIGSSIGAVIPQEMLAVETPEGYFLTPDPAIEEQVKAGRDFMKEYRDTSKAIAK